MILGTAGHVDHGKTALVKALTGVDTDRLAEERRRGLTIELGFAPLTLPGGQMVSIVDVPGHEKFVPTMLSGCAGMDLVVLAIAADQGPMPQTREHLAILSLLGLKGGVIALTRADLGIKPGVEEQVRALVKGTFLEDALIIPTSAVTGAGLEKLKGALAKLVEETPPPKGGGDYRLHVDRVFSVAGSGTVVTGTLTGGSLRRGDKVRIWPGDKIARVRGLQSHGADLEKLAPGSRAAVNLAGVDRGEVSRGDTLAPAEGLTLTQRLDMALKVLPQAPYAVKNNSTLHLHHGGRALMCRCILLGRDKLEVYLADYKKRSDTLSNKEQDTLRDMRICQEMYARGFTFLPIDIYRAKATHFQIIDGKLMPSLSSIDGLGEKAAEGIVEAAKDGPFLSKEDFQNRTKVSKTICDLMADLGLLGDLPESNQLSLFDFA